MSSYFSQSIVSSLYDVFPFRINEGHIQMSVIEHDDFLDVKKREKVCRRFD